MKSHRRRIGTIPGTVEGSARGSVGQIAKIKSCRAVGIADGPDRSPTGGYLDGRVIRLCGWCSIDGPMLDQDEVRRELALARTRSVASRHGGSGDIRQPVAVTFNGTSVQMRPFTITIQWKT